MKIKLTYLISLILLFMGSIGILNSEVSNTGYFFLFLALFILGLVLFLINIDRVESFLDDLNYRLNEKIFGPPENLENPRKVAIRGIVTEIKLPRNKWYDQAVYGSGNQELASESEVKDNNPENDNLIQVEGSDITRLRDQLEKISEERKFTKVTVDQINEILELYLRLSSEPIRTEEIDSCLSDIRNTLQQIINECGQINTALQI